MKFGRNKMRTPFRERYMKRKKKALITALISHKGNEQFDYQFTLTYKNRINFEKLRNMIKKEFESKFSTIVQTIIITNIIKEN